MPKVDIVIPCHELYETLRACIDSVVKTKKYNPNTFGNIIVVDDMSTSQGSLEEYFGDEYPDVKFVRNTERKYFSGTVNHGFSHVTSKYFIMMNSDTIVRRKDWLDVMVSEFEANKDIRLLSARSTDKFGLKFRKRYAPIAFFFMMIESEVFKEYGTLNESEGFEHWNSDVELNHKILKDGYAIGISSIRVIHKGGQSKALVPKHILDSALNLKESERAKRK